LTGRVIIITGANSGYVNIFFFHIFFFFIYSIYSHHLISLSNRLGYAATVELAKRKATIWMLCRNKDKAEKAKDEIVQKTGNSNIFIHLIDVSRPAQIKAFAADFIKGGSRLDCLINNAGLLLEKREVTEEKIEMTFATNTLAGFLLTGKEYSKKREKTKINELLKNNYFDNK